MDEQITDTPEARDATEERSFAETALEMAGKSADEARRVGTVDHADDVVEAMFEERFQTAHSPLHRAVWGPEVPIDLFESDEVHPEADLQRVMDESVDFVQARRMDGTLLGENGKLSDATFGRLGELGYWGLLVGKEYGGAGASFSIFAPFLARMAAADPTVAGMASVHQCIGAVDPLTAFGTEEQKQRFLPSLASGERLSAFALTEPGAGSDLTALRTAAVRDGDEFVITGEKLFITNVRPGRTVALVCLVDDGPAVLIVDLPDEETDSFHLNKYDLHALRDAYNYGMVFDGFRVPATNLLDAGTGDGLTIAYHGLNKGRVALCANASGSMAIMAASMIPWVHKRETYGQPIATRELVQRRLGRLVGRIVAADALVAWTSRLLDDGYRGEMECIVAKIFGAEAEKDAAIEFMMKTHGGRSFLKGHVFGDYIHDFLAPSIYEGEGEMLGMALFKSLVKDHGRHFYEPMGKAMQAAGISKPNPLDPRLMWAVRSEAVEYGKWFMRRRVRRLPSADLSALPKRLAGHAEFAADFLQKSSLEIDGSMRKHQLALADRQARIAELTQRVVDATVILCTALYAGRRSDELITLAADTMCDELTQKLTGKRPSDKYFRKVTKLGEAVADGEFAAIPAIPDSILMDY